MSLNPGGVSYAWNHTNPDRAGFSLELTGTVVAMQKRQARDWDNVNHRPGLPKFFSSGKPKMNIRMTFALADGSIKTFEFAMAGKKQQAGEKPSVHMDLYRLSGGDMDNLYGRTLHIQTWPANPTTGVAWGLGNPRLYEVTEVPGVVYEPTVIVPDELKVPELLADDGASGGQPNAQPPVYGQFYAPPQPVQQQPVYQPQPAYQPQQQAYRQQPAYQPQPAYRPQPVYQPQPAYQPPAPQPMQPQMPQGMDPVVAAAMQAVGATNVQPVYDDIPF